MKATSDFRTTFRNRMGDLESFQEAFAAFLEAHGVPEEAREEIRLICEEVLVNVISYAYDDDAEHTIEVLASATAEAIAIEFRDHGRPFDPLQVPTPDLNLPPADRPIGGLGIHLVRSLADRVEYRRQDGANLLRVERVLRRA